MPSASGNRVTEDLTIVSDGKCPASQWKPIIPTKGSILNDVEHAVKKCQEQNLDREWLSDFQGHKVCISEVDKTIHSS